MGINPRKAFESLNAAEPILVQDSLPFGSDNMDTFPLQAGEFESLADRFNEPIPEEPNLEGVEPPVLLLHLYDIGLHHFGVIGGNVFLVPN